MFKNTSLLTIAGSLYSLKAATTKNFLNEEFSIANNSHKWGCGRCLLNGHTYVVSTVRQVTWYGESDNYDPSLNACCQNDNIDQLCLSASSTLWDSTAGKISTFHTKSTNFVSRQLALIACPQKQAFCTGAAELRHYKLNSFRNAEQFIKFDPQVLVQPQDQCTWLIESQCGGAPAWEVDYANTSITDDMAWFHFLEYGGAAQGVEFDAAYSDWPAKDTPVNEFGMAYGFKPGQLYPAAFDITPEGLPAKTNIIEVPMGLVSSEMTAKQEQVQAYFTRVPIFKKEREAYETNRAAVDAYNAYANANIITQMWYDFQSLIVGDGRSLLKLIPIPVWPAKPSPYTGPVIGTDGGLGKLIGRKAVIRKEDLELTGGFGLPSAGMLKIADGSKAFGVLGQAKNGFVKDKAGKDVEIPWDAARRGQVFPEEDLAKACQPGFRNYVALTIIPKKTFTGKLTLKLKNVRFNSADKKVHLLPPDPSQAQWCQVRRPVLPVEITPPADASITYCADDLLPGATSAPAAAAP